MRELTEKETEFFEWIPMDMPQLFAEFLAELYKYYPDFEDWTIVELIELFEKLKEDAIKKKRKGV
jgi:hypothetical protein